MHKNQAITRYFTVSLFVQIFFPVLFLLFSHPHAGTTQTKGTFLRNRAHIAREQYRECTGDLTLVTDDKIREWVNGLNAWVSSPQFDTAFEVYVRISKLKTRDIKPCEVYVWYVTHELETNRDYHEIAKALAEQRRLATDSLELDAALNDNPPSGADFDSIPFGVSEKIFHTLFSLKYSLAIQKEGDRLLVRAMTLDDMELSMAFYFGYAGKLYRYEAQSALYDAAYLDDTVRLIAERLARRFESRIGVADRIFRTGYFDIVQGRLSPTRSWTRGDIAVTVGMGTHKHRYYAKVIVTNEALAGEERVMERRIRLISPEKTR